MVISQESEIVESVLALGNHIGNTPLYELQHISPKKSVRILAKLEWMQFGGSVKARPAYNIIKQAVLNGDLGQGKILLDASSGNTAIAYATIGARLGIPVTICLPENASWERKMLLKGLGVSIVYTSKFGSTDEAQEKALELYQNEPDKYFLADQYGNENNWKAHYDTTSEEIISKVNGSLTHFVTGLGTTGSFTGISKRLKEVNEGITTIALQPDGALHGLEGWKDMETAKVPGIYDPSLADRFMNVDTFDAYETLKLAAKKEGLMISPSAAANLKGALQLAEEIDEGVIVTLFPDNAEKYSEVIKSLF
ncbi:MAG: cysteine synthase family protein [Reichenbachiella sp.]|uniref:PLP-dependent cysteine synthase family protein n=1 Tax=Reichenbachiella sp. TaxID=2184521 RepID=UPI0029676C86|nr:cysteine synthase family protein [Reichenbachiella sp.]MDW3210805.1 cysteine synthase family protein [Reichenbachiella sp.]